MCGIAGVFYKRNIDLRSLDRFRSLVRTKQHDRGPDDFNEYQITKRLYFFHNRLSIIDLAHAKQPMVSERGVITYNGEIYNFREIRDSRIQYELDSDTEVLLKGLDHEYLSFLDKTNSMFGFGYYNREGRILTLVRDRMGIKPVYYIDNEDVFAFASTLTPLVVFSKKELNEKALWGFYLNRAFKSPHTIFKDIKKLESGSFLEFNTTLRQIIRSKKWWERQPLSITDEKPNQIIDNVDQLLHSAVRERLVADVPVGAYLSGGVDSSIIAAIASKYYSGLHTFTVASRDERYDESKHARRVCERYGVHYHDLVIDGKDYFKSIDHWIQQQDDIVSDPSALLLYNISELARDMGFKVMLSGEGSDELFGGYASYYRLRNSILAHRFLRPLKPLADPLSKLFRDSRKRHFLHQLLNHPVFYGTALVIEPYLLSDLLPGIEASPEVAYTLRDAMSLDVGDRIPNDLLIRTDRATMGASIEARVPFLAHQIVDYTASLREEMLIHRFETKSLLKKLAERYVPRSNIYRKKVGFELPLRDWLRHELKELVYDLIDNSVQRDLVNIAVVRALFHEHLTGRIDASAKLWAFTSLELSCRYLRNNS